MTQERRPQELAALREYFAAAGLSSRVDRSPLSGDYAEEQIRILWVDPPRQGTTCEFWTTEEDFSAEPTLAVRCQPRPVA